MMEECVLCLDVGGTEIKAAALAADGSLRQAISHFPAMADRPAPVILSHLATIVRTVQPVDASVSGVRLAFPALDAHIVTPISPFAGAFPPLVLPRESSIQITCLEDRETFITIDGQDSYDVRKNDTVLVKSAEHKISMFVSDPRWFWKRLRERGFIMPGPGKYTNR